MRFLLLILFFFPLCAAEIPGKVTICGVCKDVEKTIPYTISNLETLGALFDDYRIFIYENNSSDKTPSLLHEWSQKNSKVHITSEIVDHEILSKSCFNITEQNEFSRTERIARARNIVLDQIMKPQYDDYAYVIWVDLDFGHTFPFDAIVKTFQSKKEWDAVLANGVAGKHNAYFDVFAFRDAKQPLGPEFLGNIWWKLGGKRPFRTWKKKFRNTMYLWDYMSIRRKHNFQFHPGSEWYPVYSAFGGIGIYKRKAIQGCRYSGIVTEDLSAFAKRFLQNKKQPQIDLYLQQNREIRHLVHLPETRPEMAQYHDLNCGFIIGKADDVVFRMNSGVCQYPAVCEHVPFHASMIIHGHDKLFINPDLVLFYDGR